MERESGLAEGLASGLTEGLSSGLTEGLTEGLSSGLTEGLTGGLASGLTEGLTEGLVTGLTEGLTEGLSLGLALGLASGLTEGVVGQRTDFDAGFFIFKKNCCNRSLATCTLFFFVMRRLTRQFVFDILNVLANRQYFFFPFKYVHRGDLVQMSSCNPLQPDTQRFTILYAEEISCPPL